MAAALLTPAAVEAAAASAPAPVGQVASPRCDLPETEFITAEPWATRKLGYQSVWPTTRGAGVTVGVVDTGVDATHPMLTGHVLAGTDIVNGGGRADTDCAGHGTAVAGIIAAQPQPGIGFSGVAPDATILPVRQANTVDGTISTLAAGIRAAVDGGARVVNVSVVVPEPALPLARAVAYALDHDVVVVAAAGNDAQQGSPGQYPAGFPGVIAVGAVGADGRPGEFSQPSDNISVVAPGVNIVVPGAGGPGLLSGRDGTSYAAPFVAGVAALIRAYRPELTAAQVKHRIEATADRPTEYPCGRLPDPVYGFGMVNPLRAVTADLPEEDNLAGQAGSGSEARAGAIAAARGLAPSPQSERTWSLATVGISLLVVCAVFEIAVFAVIGLKRRGWRLGWCLRNRRETGGYPS